MRIPRRVSRLRSGRRLMGVDVDFIVHLLFAVFWSVLAIMDWREELLSKGFWNCGPWTFLMIP